MHTVRLVAQPHPKGPWLGSDGTHRQPEQAGHRRQEGPLHQDRERDDHHDDPVEPRRLVDVRGQDEAAQQDRHRALEPGEQDEAPLVARQVGRDEAQPHEHRPDHERHDGAEHQAGHPDVRPGKDAEVQRETEHAEGHDLAQACQCRVEALDLPLEGSPYVPHEDPGDEDGEKSRAVGDGGQPVEDEGAHERSERVEALARQADAAHEPDKRQAAGDADRGTDAHLEGELAHDVPDRARTEATGRDQAGHERDADRVVSP